MLDIILGIIAVVLLLWLLYWMFVIMVNVCGFIVLPIYYVIIKPIKMLIERTRKKKSAINNGGTSVRHTPEQIRALCDSVDFSNYPVGSAGYYEHLRRQGKK